MGLERQQSFQRTLLARCRSFTVADCVSRAAMAFLGVERLSINPTCSDSDEREALMAVWKCHSRLTPTATSCVQQYLQRVNQEAMFQAGFSKDFVGFSKSSFLEQLDGDGAWTALCIQVSNDISAFCSVGFGASGSTRRV